MSGLIVSSRPAFATGLARGRGHRDPLPRPSRAGCAAGRRDDARLPAYAGDVGACSPSVALRDVEHLECQQVGDRLGCSAATAIHLYRATPEAVLEDDLARVDRVLYLTAAMTGLRQGRAARSA